MLPGAPEGLVHWRLTCEPDDLAWLCLDRADVGTNTLSEPVMQELSTLLDYLGAQRLRGLVVHSGKASGFIAGADIHEFPKLNSEERARALTREGQATLDRLETLPYPTVAVLNGFALGGGLELALACTYRIALRSDERTLGLPEVQLGLHPGFGGTVRLPQLIGARKALDLILTGRSVSPVEAANFGLVDRVVEADEWRQRAAELIGQAPPKHRAPWLDRLLTLPPVRPLVSTNLGARAARRAPPEHYPAPGAILDLWRRHGGAPTAEAYADEAASFARLVMTPASRNLVRVFFLQDRLKGLGRRSLTAKRVHVIGAGVMGGDIAAWCALRGLHVTLQDRELKFIEPALQRAARLFAKRIRDPRARSEAEARLRADVEGNGASEADLVIEAVFEDRAVKRSVYAALEPRLQPEAILATNTSSIPLEELAAELARPERLIGLHFFNPVAKLPLVEVVSTPRSSAEAVTAGLAFTRQIGKLPLPCRSQPGFLVNRILTPYMAEALCLAREGVPLAEIDHAAVAFGMPVGPIELADSVGLDVALHVARILADVVGRPVGPELEAHVNAGQLGVKSGQGFYSYRDGKAVKPALHGHPVDPDVQERLVLALLNEAATCLAERVVEDADLVDAGVIFGTGFAPFRGGPLHYARERGLESVLASLETLAREVGPRFRPSRGWSELGA